MPPKEKPDTQNEGPSHRTVSRLLEQHKNKLDERIAEYAATGRTVPADAYVLRAEIERLIADVNDGIKFDDGFMSRYTGVAELYPSLMTLLGGKIYSQDRYGR